MSEMIIDLKRSKKKKSEPLLKFDHLIFVNMINLLLFLLNLVKL